MEPKQSSAKSAALRLLTTRDRSVQEIRERLERNYTKDEVAETIAYLEEIGYLDDWRYAKNHVENRNRNRPTGNYLLRLELGKKGISDQIVDQVINPPEIEYELALTVAKQRLGSLERVDALARVRRLYGLLQRRGFPVTTARSVVGELLDRDPENEYN
ncbi:MAG: regulatory protein RecX [Firmicutes bacterium]|nr:regulatory protein RecX [Bacillota bacterium]